MFLLGHRPFHAQIWMKFNHPSVVSFAAPAVARLFLPLHQEYQVYTGWGGSSAVAESTESRSRYLTGAMANREWSDGGDRGAFTGYVHFT